MKRRVSGLIVALSLAFGVSGGAEAQTPALAVEPGDAVEVREGDTWSSAEFLVQEGRRYQIRYDDGTEEWVTADRLRPVGGDAGTDKPRRFRQGQDVELKKQSRWEAAEIKRAAPPLYLVATKEGMGTKQFFWEWVDAERLRTPGEDYEGPDTRSQFGETVGSDSIKDSLAEAKKAYEEHLRKQSQTARKEDGKIDPFAAMPFEYPVSEADRRDMQEITVADVGWGEGLVDPADEPVTRSGAFELRSGTGEIFERPEALSVSGRMGLVSIASSPPGGARTVWVERVDLVAGRSRGVSEFDAASQPMAISDDGTRVLGVSYGRGSGTQQRVDVWDWSGKTPTHVKSFVPFVARQDFLADVAVGVWIDADTLVVASRGGAVSAWEASTGRGLWEVTGLRSNRPAGLTLSPGRDLIAVTDREVIYLLESRSGRVRASIPDVGFTPGSLSFSRDGQTLVAGGGDRVKGWDLSTQTAWPSVALPPGGRRDSVAALDGGLVAAGGAVIDLASGQTLRRIDASQVRPVEQTADAGRWLSLSRDITARREERPAFTCHVWSWDELRLPPTPDASPVATVAARGESVSIDLSRLDVTPAQRDAIQQAWTEKFRARGVEVSAEAQPLRLVGVTATESEQRVYEEQLTALWDRESETVNVDTKTYRLALEVDERPAMLWTYRVSASQVVRREDGQSIQDAVNTDVANRAVAVADSLQQPTLPDLIPDPRLDPAPVVTLSPDGFAR